MAVGSTAGDTHDERCVRDETIVDAEDRRTHGAGRVRTMPSFVALYVDAWIRSLRREDPRERGSVTAFFGSHAFGGIAHTVVHARALALFTLHRGDGGPDAEMLREEEVELDADAGRVRGRRMLSDLGKLLRPMVCVSFFDVCERDEDRALFFCGDGRECAIAERGLHLVIPELAIFGCLRSSVAHGPDRSATSR